MHQQHQQHQGYSSQHQGSSRFQPGAHGAHHKHAHTRVHRQQFASASEPDATADEGMGKERTAAAAAPEAMSGLSIASKEQAPDAAMIAEHATSGAAVMEQACSRKGQADAGLLQPKAASAEAAASSGQRSKLGGFSGLTGLAGVLSGLRGGAAGGGCGGAQAMRPLPPLPSSQGTVTEEQLLSQASKPPAGTTQGGVFGQLVKGLGLSAATAAAGRMAPRPDSMMTEEQLLKSMAAKAAAAVTHGSDTSGGSAGADAVQLPPPPPPPAPLPAPPAPPPPPDLTGAVHGASSTQEDACGQAPPAGAASTAHAGHAPIPRMLTEEDILRRMGQLPHASCGSHASAGVGAADGASADGQYSMQAGPAKAGPPPGFASIPHGPSMQPPHVSVYPQQRPHHLHKAPGSGGPMGTLGHGAAGIGPQGLGMRMPPPGFGPPPPPMYQPYPHPGAPGMAMHPPASMHTPPTGFSHLPDGHGYTPPGPFMPMHPHAAMHGLHAPSGHMGAAVPQVPVHAPQQQQHGGNGEPGVLSRPPPPGFGGLPGVLHSVLPGQAGPQSGPHHHQQHRHLHHGHQVHGHSHHEGVHGCAQQQQPQGGMLAGTAHARGGKGAWTLEVRADKMDQTVCTCRHLALATFQMGTGIHL